MGVHAPRAGPGRLGVDRRDDALRAVSRGRGVEQRRVGHAGGIDADLVGAGIEERPDVLDRIHASAHRQRNEHDVRHRLDHAVEEAARLDARADVEEGELVGALGVVAPRHLDGVAGIAQVDEVHALDHAARGDVETGDDALGESHERIGME